jgi:hypothetical protein
MSHPEVPHFERSSFEAWQLMVTGTRHCGDSRALRDHRVSPLVGVGEFGHGVVRRDSTALVTEQILPILRSSNDAPAARSRRPNVRLRSWTRILRDPSGASSPVRSSTCPQREAPHVRAQSLRQCWRSTRPAAIPTNSRTSQWLCLRVVRAADRSQGPGRHRADLSKNPVGHPHMSP